MNAALLLLVLLSSMYLPSGNFSKTVDDQVYEIGYRTALGVLERASEVGVLSYEIEAWEWGIFVDCINWICARDGGGWMYWVNYPLEETPMVSADKYPVEPGDVLTWYYAESWNDTPATSKCIVNFTIDQNYEVTVHVNCTIQWMAYDTNRDSTISDKELISAILDWIGGKIPDVVLISVIIKWLG